MALNCLKLPAPWVLVCLLLCSFAQAQDQDQALSALDGSDGEAVADLIKSNHDMAKAVYLTRVAEQLSLSFASHQQMSSHWQQALLENVSAPHNLSQIDTHALMAQVLIRYSNGMDLNRWRMVDLSPQKPLPKLSEHMSATQQFTAWLNLTHYWQDILQRLSSQGSSAWLGITTLDKPEPPLSQQLQLSRTLAFVNQLPDPPKTDKQSQQYSNKLRLFSQQWSTWQPLPTILLRQSWHHNRNQWMAWAYDWIEIYQRIELSQHLLTAQEQELLQQHIVDSKTQWLAQKAIIEGRDKSFYVLIGDIFEQLPVKFKNPDHSNESINSRILTLATGIQDPIDYFRQPLRDQIQENLEVCLNLSTHQPPNPEQPIADNQFDSCLQDFTDWAQIFAFEPGLAGQFTVLDSAVSLARVLDMSPPQIINYLPAQTIQNPECLNQMTLQPNPVEWLLAVESLNWLHDRWPGIFAEKPLPEQTVQNILNSGLNAYRYPDCYESKSVLSQEFIRLEQKWSTVKQAIRLHLKDYRDTHLAKGSDIDFFQNTDQLTDAVPDNLTISPCDTKTACGAFVQLKPDNKVLQLFPNHLKVAQQFQLGDLSICYDQVGWQERKSLPGQINNKKIANFEGQLGLTLVGKFQQDIVFEQRLETTDRYVYLFAENNQSILDMACPLSIIGQQITTTLDRGTFGLLPNRLTFLTAQKVDVNNIIKHHWQQWQNNLDPAKVNLVNAMDNIKPMVNEAFIQHTNTVQQQIYRKLTTSNPARINDSALSNAVFEYLTERRRLAATVRALFPNTFHKDMSIRSSLTGTLALPDIDFFRQAFEAQLNLLDMMEQGDALMEQHKPAWFDQQRIFTEDFLQPTLMQFYKRFAQKAAVKENDRLYSAPTDND
ncbi:hypothetical protein [Marinicella gelatinilytica]|uniref:hypothetical protein n=1 Tax=Marinicella gelatinilytica TaxID=2996017 RepID=UPI002260A2A4|nr:hypothetical protein [Marinicella gelatinilytica]MCX7544556.1 hypothetical protein [Marinicella gelatinilytica]